MLASVVVIVGAVVYVRHSGSGPSTIRVAESSTTTATKGECTLPSLPVPGAHAAGAGPFDMTLSGPAVTSLRGGAALAPFALDGGQLTVTPPRAGDAPTVSATDAECTALATNSANGWSLLQDASLHGGAAVGYGRVSITPDLVAAAQKAPNLAGQVDQNTHPVMPGATPYQDRLAWVVVVREVEIYNGPAGPIRTTPAASTTTTSPGEASHGYLVFLVDAHTGSDALLYAEGQSPGTGGSVSVPAERVSVPWTLVSRAPDGYAGKMSITVLPCDGYPNPVNVDRDRAAVGVVVERPVGADCGAPKQVTIALHAATVTSDIPAELSHDPLGPDVALESPNAPASPGDTGGVLQIVSDADAGKTIQMTVGSVLAIGPLHVSHHYAADPVASSDPTVVGPLDDSVPDEVHEYRAWRTGRADVSVPGSTWVVHVEVK